MTKNAKVFRGAFIMRLQDHGILTCTYFDNSNQMPYPEIGKRIGENKGNEDSFVGKFSLVGIRYQGSYDMQLSISRNSRTPLYKLIWKHEDGIETFLGEAVLDKDILFGYYW
ncbi:MAG: hypothetical protein KA821_08890 [Chitinophagaceae bacterium]|nr:hypothetical protein [Chitinophagaceae bacterium]